MPTPAGGVGGSRTVAFAPVNPDPGDEIIVTPWTYGGSLIGALLHKCVSIFADIDDTYTPDPADVERKITKRRATGSSRKSARLPWPVASGRVALSRYNSCAMSYIG